MPSSPRGRGPARARPGRGGWGAGSGLQGGNRRPFLTSFQVWVVIFIWVHSFLSWSSLSSAIKRILNKEPWSKNHPLLAVYRTRLNSAGAQTGSSLILCFPSRGWRICRLPEGRLSQRVRDNRPSAGYTCQLQQPLRPPSSPRGPAAGMGPAPSPSFSLFPPGFIRGMMRAEEEEGAFPPPASSVTAHGALRDSQGWRLGGP